MTPLSDNEKNELAELNAAVESAVKARTDWLDRKMVEHSNIQVGDTVYDLRSGRPVGVVAELYRYWGNGRDWRYDTNLSCEYRFTNGGNTSSRPELWIGTQDQVKARQGA